jgi:hypothetical protein
MAATPITGKTNSWRSRVVEQRHGLGDYSGIRNMSSDAETEISGMYGFEMLQILEIKIDYRDGLVAFNFDSKRFHSPSLL